MTVAAVACNMAVAADVAAAVAAASTAASARLAVPLPPSPRGCFRRLTGGERGSTVATAAAAGGGVTAAAAGRANDVDGGSGSVGEGWAGRCLLPWRD